MIELAQTGEALQMLEFAEIWKFLDRSQVLGFEEKPKCSQISNFVVVPLQEGTKFLLKTYLFFAFSREPGVDKLVIKQDRLVEPLMRAQSFPDIRYIMFNSVVFTSLVILRLRMTDENNVVRISSFLSNEEISEQSGCRFEVIGMYSMENHA